MLRSVSVTGNTPAATFLEALHRDLVDFGRDDVLLVNLSDTVIFHWNPDFTSSASSKLREQAFAARLAGSRHSLMAQEASLPSYYFDSFDVDFSCLTINVVPCARQSAEERLFDYIAKGQSVVAETQKMRVGKFLIFDETPSPARVMGAIALKSPKYFDGARDQHLDWPPINSFGVTGRVTDQAAIELRNIALKSIFNIAVCMVVPPYCSRGVGKLIAALSLSDPVIAHMESHYADPVLGLTTTGIWGGSAGQYEKIRLGLDTVGGLRGRLFERTHTVTRSLNSVPHLFSSNTYNSAYDLIRLSHLKIRPFRGYATDPVIRQNLLYAAISHVHLPRRAIAANVVSHYFGAVSQACRNALSTLEGLKEPPSRRSLTVQEIYEGWLSVIKPTPIVGGVMTRLSEHAT